MESNRPPKVLLPLLLIAIAACGGAPVAPSDTGTTSTPAAGAKPIQEGTAPAAAMGTTAATSGVPAAGPRAPDEFDALARKIVEAKTHAAYSPSAYSVAFLRCTNQEGSGSECRLVTLDATIQENDLAQGILLWSGGQDPRSVMPQALAKVTTELRAKKYIELPRLEWADAGKPLDVPGLGKFEVRGDVLRSPRPTPLAPLETPLQKQAAPYKNRPTVAYASPDVHVAIVEITRDPGDKAGPDRKASTYVRIVPVGLATTEPIPKPVKGVTHGGSYFAVYLAIAKPGDPSLKKAFDTAKARDWSPTTGELKCDHGAMEALGYKEDMHATAVYFDNEDAARRFAERQRPKPIAVLRIKTMCAD